MHSALRKPTSATVPSRCLLRFLHSQSEIAFFSKNDGASAVTHHQPRCWSKAPAKRRQPPLSGCQLGGEQQQQQQQHQHLQASLFTLDPFRRRKTNSDNAKSEQPGNSRAFTTGQTALRKWHEQNTWEETAKGVAQQYEKDQEKAKKLADKQAASWQERLWGSSGSQPAQQPEDSAYYSDNRSFLNNRRILSSKTSIDPRLRCTEVDGNGKVILTDGEFKKTELIAKYGLLPRDLRKIDSSNLPHILVRPSAILLNLLHLKVLIRHDRVLLFDVYGSKTSYPQSAFMYDLQGKLQQKSPPGSPGLPYEFRALEAVLTSVTSELEADFEAVREPVMHILSELEDDIDRHKLRMLLILSKRISTFEQKAKLVRDAIEELLEADDDLASMYLTEKVHDLRRELDDHTEIEMLLESYNKLTDEIVQEAGNLVSGIRNTEEIVRAILDANRNALMLLELKFSVGTLGLAMGTFLAGLYGMNLENFIEETNWGFGAVTGVSVLFSLIVCWYGLIKLRKIQRVKMMSDGGSSSSSHGGSSMLPRWQQYTDDGALGLLDSRNREMLRRAHSQRAAAAKKKWSLFR